MSATAVQDQPNSTAWCPASLAANSESLPGLGKASEKNASDAGDSSDKTERPRRPTVCEILRRYAPAYLKIYGCMLDDFERRTLQALTLCRTSALGGHSWKCKLCGGKHASFNSCHSRHCPGCGENRRDEWLDQLSGWLLPVDYWHLVFTVPHDLNRLIEANRKACFKLQFDVTRWALKRVASDPKQVLGSLKVGFTMLLHSWGQWMLLHVHIHIVLAGGGFREDGRWVSAKKGTFFLDEELLADTYRDRYLKQLLRLHRKGKLVFPEELAPLAEEAKFQKLLDRLQHIRWVVHCGQPEHCHRPESALKYLSHYVVGSVISDRRIVSDMDGQVTIRVKDYRNAGERTTTSMPGVEFVRRFMMHVMPRGMPRVRHIGFLWCRDRDKNLASARRQLGVQLLSEATVSSAELEDALSEIPAADTNYLCPHCGEKALQWVGVIPAETGWHMYVSLIPRVVQQRMLRELREAARPPPGVVETEAARRKTNDR